MNANIAHADHLPTSNCGINSIADIGSATYITPIKVVAIFAIGVALLRHNSHTKVVGTINIV